MAEDVGSSSGLVTARRLPVLGDGDDSFLEPLDSLQTTRVELSAGVGQLDRGGVLVWSLAATRVYRVEAPVVHRCNRGDASRPLAGVTVKSNHRQQLCRVYK